VPDELTKALLLEEAASEETIAEALFASVAGGVPLVTALTEAGAVSSAVLARYLARADAPFLRQVVPVAELMERLPPGLCARLLAVPVRRDAITGTVDLVVADAADPHPGREVSFHLGAPVRLVRAPLAAIEEALRRARSRSLQPAVESAPPRRPFDTRDDDRMYDSRPRPSGAPDGGDPEPPRTSFKGGTQPPPALEGDGGGVDALTAAALRPSRLPASVWQAHAVPGASTAPRHARATPPWGTPIHNATSTIGSDPPRSGLGSEIPIPLTRRTFTAVSGGTQRPPPLVDPRDSALGEGYVVDPGHFRQIVEVNERMRTSYGAPPGPSRPMTPMASFIPGPPPLPGGGTFGAYAPQIPTADIGGILATLRAAGSRDEILELVLTGARMVAFKVALFVAKRGGYVGWTCTPEFGDRAALQAVLVPVDSGSVFDEAVRDGLYLGPILLDEVHAPILHVMRGASRDVAVVAVRVSGKTAVVIMADELGDTMLATRRLEEISRAAGEAFTRIVRTRR
jgi:hypothetical protein